MGGRHQSAKRPRPAYALAVVALAVGALGGGAVAWGVARGSDGGQPRAGVMRGSAPAAASPSASSAQEATPGWLRKCQSRVRAGEAVVRAARSSYDHWSAHVQAQLDLDAGKNTTSETEAIWAKTKKFGDSDVKAFSTAKATYDETPEACGGTSTVPARYRKAAERCAKRASAIDDVVDSGARVSADWAAHVRMMKHKDHIAGERYHDMWRTMVDQAPPRLKDFADDETAYDKAPRCTLPT